LRLIHALYFRGFNFASREYADFNTGVTVSMPQKLIQKSPRTAARLALQLAHGDYLGAIKIRRF
jgi:hypothetical protein